MGNISVGNVHAKFFPRIFSGKSGIFRVWRRSLDPAAGLVQMPIPSQAQRALRYDVRAPAASFTPRSGISVRDRSF